MNKFVPRGNRVLIIPRAAEDKTESGIIIPEDAKTRTNAGTVVAMGTQDVPRVKVGDEIAFAPHAGAKITIDNVKYMIIREDDILGVYSE